MPFELGNPFGAPNDPAFQRRVLEAVLALLDRDSGPVLEDFPDDAPTDAFVDDNGEGWACPIVLQRPKEESELLNALLPEVGKLRPWYDQSVADRGRTTVGVSEMEIDDIARFLIEFVDGKTPDNPRPDMDVAECLKHAIEDLKTYYSEAVAAQPGRARATPQEVYDWFWNETVAAKVMHRLDKVCAASDAPIMQSLHHYLLLPREQTKSDGSGSDGRINPGTAAA